MSTNPRYRLAIDAPLAPAAAVTLSGNAAHYLSTVLRLKPGDAIALFNRTDGEWRATITDIRKKELTLMLGECLRTPSAHGPNLMVCFAPIKGGRMETIIEKATELGASVLQPVITQRTIVDKVNIERADAIAREAAEQCERIDWPEIREPVKLIKLLGDWPADLPLIYGDERGEGMGVVEMFPPPAGGSSGGGQRLAPNAITPPPQPSPGVGGGNRWAVLAGPEGGFTPEEFAALARVKSAHGVSLGPRILRADTAVITLCVATLMAWGDWNKRPRFIGKEER